MVGVIRLNRFTMDMCIEWQRERWGGREGEGRREGERSGREWENKARDSWRKAGSIRGKKARAEWNGA